MTEIRKKVFQGLEASKSPEPRHSQLIAGEVEIEGSRERDNYRVPISGTEMKPGPPWGAAERYLLDLNNRYPDVKPLGELVIGDGNYSYVDKRYIVTADVLRDFSNEDNRDNNIELLTLRGLKVSVKKVIEGFDKEIFVRNIENDGDSGWAVKLLPYISALQELTDLTKEDEPEEDKSGE